MDACRLLVDDAAAGQWNMAVDEVLLESAARNGQPTMRLYRWAEPTLSLGYFQHYADRETHKGSRRAAIVRRSSGGGAILHDRELTYSLALPALRGLAARAKSLYESVHAALIEVLADWNVSASLCRVPANPIPQREPFLCFQRRSDGDVLLGGEKIAGSAQRRRKGVVLQHGSVLLARSPRAPELPGLRELAAAEIQPDLLGTRWCCLVAGALDLDLQPASLTDAEQSRAKSLQLERFGKSAWIWRR